MYRTLINVFDLNLPYSTPLLSSYLNFTKRKPKSVRQEDTYKMELQTFPNGKIYSFTAKSKNELECLKEVSVEWYELTMEIVNTEQGESYEIDYFGFKDDETWLKIERDKYGGWFYATLIVGNPFDD